MNVKIQRFREKGELNSLSSDLNFPSPPGCSEAPVWTANGFRIGGKLFPILSYDVGPIAWNDELTETHEKLAGDEHYIDRASREHAAEELKRWVTDPDSRIMDIGCSSGLFLRLLRERFPGRAIVGADCILGPLERLSKIIPDIPLLQFDLLKCPWPDRSFDGLVLLNVLEHIEHDVDAVRQVYRILKPGGVAVIEVPAGPRLYDVYDRELMHFRRYRMGDLLKTLRTAGFEVAAKSHLGFFLFPGFWFVKKKNRKFLNAEPELRREVLRQSIRGYRGSALMHAIMRLESKLRRFIYYPLGIRCLVTCRKPLI
jgi:SAM-dependent methyltransferase